MTRKLYRLWQSDQDDFYWLLFLCCLDFVYSDEMLLLAKGAIMQPAKEFYPIIISVPFLALCMMGNNVIRAEGKLNLL
jgi:Na+-driven multidrug efflux pump